VVSNKFRWDQHVQTWQPLFLRGLIYCQSRDLRDIVSDNALESLRALLSFQEYSAVEISGEGLKCCLQLVHCLENVLPGWHWANELRYSSAVHWCMLCIGSQKAVETFPLPASQSPSMQAEASHALHMKKSCCSSTALGAAEVETPISLGVTLL